MQKKLILYINGIETYTEPLYLPTGFNKQKVDFRESKVQESVENIKQTFAVQIGCNPYEVVMVVN